jgi:hypothetical protein
MTGHLKHPFSFLPLCFRWRKADASPVNIRRLTLKTGAIRHGAYRHPPECGRI